VRRWDGGAFGWVEDAPGRVVIDAAGDRLRGRVELRFCSAAQVS
jgi:hypothetical protein